MLEEGLPAGPEGRIGGVRVVTGAAAGVLLPQAVPGPQALPFVWGEFVEAASPR